MVTYDLRNGWGIDPGNNPSMIYYINCRNEPENCNAIFRTVGTGKWMQVFAFAKEDIPERREVFAQYNDERLEFLKSALVPIAKSCLKLSRTCAGGSVIIQPGSYVEINNGYFQGRLGPTWKARVDRISIVRKKSIKLQVSWLYTEKDLETHIRSPMPYRKGEFFMTNHTQIIDVDVIMGLAKVTESVSSSKTTCLWWERFYDFKLKSFKQCKPTSN
ncbi:hypothetical protein BJ878DRAFT_529948 [Calycina marina]|uniref:Uncharacterized protein n=1 Tax=Calycina marina TaxID=1763456 RepID=A0A9P7YVJ7_9HELO|nr:hypothetical protein BJ878DRAFT_529948 [Calycina marina]